MMAGKGILKVSGLVIIIIVVVFGIIRVNQKHMDIWLSDYFLGSYEEAPSDGIVDIMLLISDHYEPGGNEKTLNFFIEGFRELSSRHIDSDGAVPRHTWFYPLEQFRGYEVDSLVSLCRDGLGEIEIHLHHSDDTDSSFREKMVVGIDSLRSHGALVCSTDVSYFGFVHGNWALDNSRLEDGRNYCGVNNEITILKDLGCYGDFTFPALFQTAQPNWTRAIGFVEDDPTEPKSYDTYIPAEVGRAPLSNEFMIFQGPLYIDWEDWRFGFHPTIDDAGITAELLPTPHRVDGWLKNSAYVKGNSSWRFIKLHTHAGNRGDANAFVGKLMDSTLTYLESKYNDGIRFRLHYVTAREAFNIVCAAEEGMQGNPNRYRNFLLPRYVYAKENSKK